MHSTPSRCHRGRRLSWTSRCLTSSHEASVSDVGFGDQPGQLGVERVEPTGPQPGVAALGDQVGDLEVAGAGNHDERASGCGARDQRVLAVLGARQPEPPDVEGHRVVLGVQPGLPSDHRRTAVARHGELGAQLTGPVRAGVAHAR